MNIDVFTAAAAAYQHEKSEYEKNQVRKRKQEVRAMKVRAEKFLRTLFKDRMLYFVPDMLVVNNPFYGEYTIVSGTRSMTLEIIRPTYGEKEVMCRVSKIDGYPMADKSGLHVKTFSDIGRALQVHEGEL